MDDPHANFQAGLQAPATRAFNITPNDGADLSIATRALHVKGDSGLVAFITVAGDEADAYIPQGGVLPVRVRRVLATGTVATGIVGLA